MLGKFKDQILLANWKSSKLILDIIDGENGSVLITEQGLIKEYSILEKQELRSWKSGSLLFTTGAIVDSATKNIYAVKDFVTLAKLSESDAELNKKKSFTFKNKIFKLVQWKDNIYIVFQNGGIIKFQENMLPKKLVIQPILESGEMILEAKVMFSGMIKLITKTKEDLMKVYKISMSDGSLISSATLKGNLAEINCFTLLSNGDILSLWENGSLYHHHNLDGVEFPGSSLTNIKTVDTKQECKMIQVSSDSIIIFGKSIEDEGGLLILWNWKLLLEIASKKTKLLAPPINIWNTSHGLCLTQNDALFFLFMDQTELSVADRFGYCKPKEAKIYTEDNLTQNPMLDYPLGELSEPMQLDQLLNFVLKNPDLQEFQNIITNKALKTETGLVRILHSILKTPVRAFGKEKRKKRKRKGIKYSRYVEGSPYAKTKAKWINCVLLHSFSPNFIETRLKVIGLKNCLDLLKHLQCMVENNHQQFECQPSRASCLQWMTSLLNAFVAELVISRDDKVHEILSSLTETLRNEMVDVEEKEKVDAGFVYEKVKVEDQNNQIFFIRQLRECDFVPL